VVILDIVIPVIIAGGTVIFPFTAQLIDMINEIYGRRRAYQAIILAFLANVMVSIFIFMDSLIPMIPELKDYEPIWRFFFLQTPRVVLASYTAFIICDTVDATVFGEIKKTII